MTQRPPLPPFDRDTAMQKVRMAEDAWNSRDPMCVSLANTEDSRWRTRAGDLMRPDAHAVAGATRRRQVRQWLLMRLHTEIPTGWTGVACCAVVAFFGFSCVPQVDPEPIAATASELVWVSAGEQEIDAREVGLHADGDHVTLTDEDNDNIEWIAAAPSPTAFGGTALKADASASAAYAYYNNLYEGVATYAPTFTKAGSYRLYVRARGFSTSSDSILTATTFGGAPSTTLTLNASSTFQWFTTGSATFQVNAGDVMVPRSFKVAMRERDAEVDAIVFSLDTLTGAQLNSLFVHTQASGANHVVIQAERPDRGIGTTSGAWTLVENGAAIAVAQGGKAIAAPANGDDVDIFYRVVMKTAGTYKLYVLGRGFNTSTDSIYASNGFGGLAGQQLNFNTSTYANGFRWYSSSVSPGFSVSQSAANAGTILELRIKSREATAQVDAIVLSTQAALSAGALNALAGFAEAEDGTLSGPTTYGHSEASGAIRVRNFGGIGESITFPALPSADAFYIRYSLQSELPKQASVYVNGEDIGTVMFTTTLSWDTYATARVPIPVSGGAITLKLDPDDHAANDQQPCASIDRISIQEPGRKVFASTTTQLYAAAAAAQPGDVMVMADSTTMWTSLDLNLTRSGTPDMPIVVRSQTAGGAVVGGTAFSGTGTTCGASGSTAWISIRGANIVVQGLRFANGSSTLSRDLVCFAEQSTRSRLTEVAFDSFNPADFATEYRWVSIDGTYQRMDHCELRNQTHQQNTVAVWPPNTCSAYDLLDHNHFNVRPKRPDGSEGWESLRVGGGATCDTMITVAHNLFERLDGELEAVSNKDNRNIYRHNTFINGDSTLSLRRGSFCRVENNFFLDPGDGDGQGGVRTAGSDHQIVNNYFYFTTYPAVNLRAAGGDVPAADRVTIAFNTFVSRPSGNNYNVAIGTGLSGLVIANNVAFGQAVVGSGVVVPSDTLYEANPLLTSMICPGGIDARCVDGLDAWHIPAGSPAIDSAFVGDSRIPAVSVDQDGQLRSTLLDIGADENVSAPTHLRRLFAADVGPPWSPDI